MGQGCGQFLRDLAAVGQVAGVQLIEVLAREGGICGRPQLLVVATDRQIAAAVRAGSIVRTRRGRYALPTASDHLARAHQMSATLSHLSAAMHWGWKVKFVPSRAQVTVGRHRTVRSEDQREVRPHWRDLAERDVVDGVTEPTRTVLDCAMDLPFDVALAVADSALRSGLVRKRVLVQEASELRGRGSAKARKVATTADHRAANPFESVLRSIALEVPHFRFTPQLQIAEPGFFAMVDLGDRRTRVVLEADSYEFHAGRSEHDADCERYDDLVVRGWIVLRFTWEKVMHRPEYVLWCLRGLAAQQRGEAVPVPAGLP